MRGLSIHGIFVVLGDIQTQPGGQGTVAGTILSQDPPADAGAPVGSRVGLRISGATAVRPNLAGMTSTAAQQALTAVHLSFAMGATVESDQAVGTVVGQVPGAGERVLQERAGDHFDGGAPAGFGAIGGWNRTSAGALYAGGLPAHHRAVGRNRVGSGAREHSYAGTSAGRSVAIGSPVRVTVATPRTVIVPQVVRMAQNGAAAALAALKLQMT